MSDIIDIEVVDLQEIVDIEAINDVTIIDVSVAEVGVAGVGVPSGGTTGQILSKATGANYDTEWADNIGSPVTSVNGELGDVVLTADDISDATTTNKFVTSSDITKLSNLSGTNTGDQDFSGLEPTISPKKTAFNVDFGSSAGTAVQGNDSRLSDARTPTAHKTSHEVGGADSLFPINTISYNTNPTIPTHSEGNTYWDKDNHTLAVQIAPDITMQIGQETFIRVCNKTGTPIANGKIVYINSADATAGFPTIQLAKADDYTTSRIIGMTTQEIAVDGCGMVTCAGEVNDLNTSSFVAGDIVYLSGTSSGTMTKVRPSTSNFVVIVGIITFVDTSVGRVFVMPKAEDYTAETHEVTGWSKYNKATIAFTNATRTLSVTPIDTTYTVYQAGVKYTKTSDSIQIPDTEGLYVVYYVAGVLTYALSPSNGAIDTIIRDYPTVAYIYWDATNQKEIYLAPELHSIEMPSTVHAYLHFVLRARWMTGLAPNNVSADASGNLVTSARFGMDAGGFVDEDLYFSTPAVDPAVGLPIFYISGTTANPTLRMVENAGFSVATTGTGRLAYNSIVAGNWTLSEVNNNDFVLCHVFSINDNSPSRRVIAMVGQNQYTTTANARAGAEDEIESLMIAGLVPSEMKAIATFVFQTSNTYTNAVKARVISFSATEPYVDFRLVAIGGGSGGGTSGGITEAPIDGLTYGRKDGGWSEMATGNVVWGDITGSIANQLDLAGELAEKEPVIAIKKTAFNVDFGTTVGTVAQGNDSRLSDSRTPVSHGDTAHSVLYAKEADTIEIDKAMSRITSTGLLDGCEITINGTDPSTFDMASGLGVVIDSWTDPANPVRTIVFIPPRTGITPPYLATDTTSYIFADSTGALVYNNYGSTAIDRRDYISIGWVDHPDNTEITDTKLQPTSLTSVVAQLNDFFLSFGAFNINGNDYGANSALTVKRSAGNTFDSNANYDNDRKSPHILTTEMETPCQLYYYYRDGAGDWVNDIAPTTNIDPNHWDDDSGTLADVIAGYWTIQAILFYAQTESNDVQYGQVQYASKALALSALKDAIDINPYNSYDTFRGWLIVQQGCTDLTNTSTAEFRAAGKLGIVDVSSGGGTGGEVNTASNIGTSGTGLYQQKIGVDLQFKNIVTTGVLGLANDDTEHTITLSHTNDSSTRHITDTLLTKLNGIESGAQVNTVSSVNGSTGAVTIPVEKKFTFVLHVGENATTGINKTNALVVTQAMTITKAFAYAKTAPTGSALIFDINKNGTSIWASTQANRIQIAGGSVSGTQTSLDTTSLVEGDILTIDIDQIGSTIAGKDITVTLRCL